MGAMGLTLSALPEERRHDLTLFGILRTGELTLRYLVSMTRSPPIPLDREHQFWLALCGYGKGGHWRTAQQRKHWKIDDFLVWTTCNCR